MPGDQPLDISDTSDRIGDLLRSAFMSAGVGMAVCNPEGRFMLVNQALADLVGRSLADLGESSIGELADPDDAQIVSESRLWSSSGRSSLECRLVRSDGHLLDVLLTSSAVSDGDDSVRCVVIRCEDITERNAREAALTHQVLHDALTDLPNRALFVDRLTQATARRTRDGGDLALLFVDLDNFKMVNDSLGHLAGDRLLVELSRRLEGLLRHSDTIARLGGDEFTVVSERSGPDEASLVAERICAAASRPFVIDGQEVTLGVSIGIVVATEGHRVPDDLLRDADLAMYRAKALGGGQFVFFDAAMRRGEP